MLLRSLAKLGVATLLLDPALKSTPLFAHLRINKYQQISTDINRFRMKWAWDKCLEILRERDWFWKHSLRWCAFLIQISHRYPYLNRNQWNGVTIWHKLTWLDIVWHSLTWSQYVTVTFTWSEKWYTYSTRGNHRRIFCIRVFLCSLEVLPAPAQLHPSWVSPDQATMDMEWHIGTTVYHGVYHGK